MGWRDRVRRAVNRADYVGPWRLAVLRVVDPMEWYMRSHDEDNVRPHRPQPRRSEGVGWTSYAPLGNAPPDRESRHVQAAEDRERRRAEAVFEHHETSPRGTGHGMARIERSQLAEAVPLLVGYLENAVVGQWNGFDPIG